MSDIRDIRDITTDTGPFAIVPEWLLDADVSGNAIKLYAILARHADRDLQAKPSRRRLAERMGCSLRTIDRLVDELAAAGALSVTARFDEAGDRTSNLYRVHRVRMTRGGDTDVATGGDTDDTTGGDTDDAVNESQFEREPSEREKSVAPALAVATPPELADAGDVVAAVVDALAEHDIPVQARHRGMLGRQAADMLRSGFEPELAVLACVTALRRGEPHHAHWIAADLAAARAGQRMTRSEYDRSLQDAVELAAAGGARRGAA